ncbi:DUF2322 family protein [Alicycliphilus denitrificans]|uniref:DUF2322 family protein n=1 Tax=Alicycliphilus denitrificans TaxID=179636 RepID=UPI003A80F92D
MGWAFEIHPRNPSRYSPTTCACFAPVTHLATIELLDDACQVTATSPNRPGTTCTLTIYAALTAKYGGILPT